MKMIHFKIGKNLAIFHYYEQSKDEFYDEIWIPEDKITYLRHEKSGKDEFFEINDYEVDKKEFEKVLKQLTTNSILGE